jgi:hypothetical protein
MADEKEFTFKLNGFTPDSIPMGRLGEYMHQVGLLLGECSGVHFSMLKPGSTGIAHKVSSESLPKVMERLRLVENGEAPDTASKAELRLNEMLAEDNIDADYLDDRNKKIAYFPGIKKASPETAYGPISQSGTIDGVVYRVGGVDNSAHVQVVTSENLRVYCATTKEIAQRLGHHLFGAEIRFSGVGKWDRSESGKWSLQGFKIESFEILEDLSLIETIAELRSISGNGWRAVNDPWAELASLRDGLSEA